MLIQGEITMDWIERKSQNTKFPTYLRTAGIDEEGTVFAPAALTGNEKNAALCAIWDGIPAAIHRGHVFLPTSWMTQHCPKIEMLCGKIESRVRAAAKVQGSGGE
jgi:hypothetical protein